MKMNYHQAQGNIIGGVVIVAILTPHLIQCFDHLIRYAYLTTLFMIMHINDY